MTKSSRYGRCGGLELAVVADQCPDHVDEPAGEGDQRHGGGTRFTRAVEMRPSGLKVLMTPMMMFMVPRRNKVFVQNLKRALES